MNYNRVTVVVVLLGLFCACCDSSNNEDMRKRYAKASLNPDDYHRDPHYLVRSRAVLSEQISPKALQTLANDPSWYVRSKVAQHGNATSEILTLLAKDTQLQVRKSVAQNRNTPSQVLVELAEDSRWQVRFAIIDNDNAPVSIFYTWCTSPSYFTKKELFYRLARRRDVLQKLLDFLHKKNATATAEKMCGEIARYACTMPEILTDLSQHPSYEIRLQVAQNRNTPLDCLQKLATDEDASVRSEVIYNSNTTKEILREMIAVENDEDLKEEAQDMLEEKGE